MISKIFKVAAVSSIALPFLALAVNSGNGSNQFSGAYVSTILASMQNWVNLLVPLLIGVAVVVFFVGLVQFIWSKADDSKTFGRRLMIWGVIAIAVMVSIWGLVGLLQNITGVGGSGDGSVPTVSVPQG